jgi:hypothetical protein
MTKTTDKPKSTASGKQPVPKGKANPEQSVQALGAAWGKGKKDGPRTTRSESMQPTKSVPGALETTQDELDFQSLSLDQPTTGGDRQSGSNVRLDQARKAGDQRVSLDPR